MSKTKLHIPILSIVLFAFAALTALSFPTLSSANARTLVPAVPDMPFVHIENANVMLYDTPNGRQITSLPQTYFAHVTGESAEFFAVIFYDLTGFVRRNAVTLVDFEPVTKFATGNLEVMRGGTVPIFNRPTHLDGSAIHYTPRGTRHIFYGTINGSIPYRVEDGAVWYFIRFENGANTEFGYIHSSNVISSVIAPNVVEKVMVYAQDPPTFNPPPFEFPPYMMIVFIVTLCIPAVLVMILIFKKPKGKGQPQKTPRSF